MSRHTRIRPFNTKDTYPEQNLDNDLCQAVIASSSPTVSARCPWLRDQTRAIDPQHSPGYGVPGDHRR